MQEGVVQYLAQVLRGLSSGADPIRLLQDALSGAIAASGGRHGMIVGLVDGAPTVISASGTTPRVVLDTAARCMDEGRLCRGRDPAAGTGAIAEPIRVGQRVVGAVSIGGQPVALDAAPLPLFADAAGLALARRPTATRASVTDFSTALVEIGRDLDPTAVLGRMFDAAARLFGALGGFCVLPDGDGWRVAQHRGISAGSATPCVTPPCLP